MRRSSRRIRVGGVEIGGGAPITVQSMCSTRTDDTAATIAQIKRLEAAGCDIVRVAVPDIAAADAIAEIKANISLPLVADIHFDWRLAVRAAERGIDKIRINPGNIGAKENVRAVVRACLERNIPIRVGVNGGSLEKGLLAKYGGVTAEALCESALTQAETLEGLGLRDICLSLKSSSVPVTIAANRLVAERSDYPLHLGVTETGTEYMGIIKSAAGIGALLADGIGDTIRVSLTAEPEREVPAGIALLRALGIRRGVELVSCPTCGRTQIDLISLAKEVEARLSGCKREIKVAVMGCVVNGPGEAREADYGIAGGIGKGVLFRHGEIVGTAPAERLADALLEMINKDGQ